MAGNFDSQDENVFGNQLFKGDESNRFEPMFSREGETRHVNKDLNNLSYGNRNDTWGNNQAQKIADQKVAEKTAREAENTASQNGQPIDAGEAERFAVSGGLRGEDGGFYRKNNGKAKTKSKIKKYGPIASVLATLITAAILLVASSALSPFGLVANGLEHFNKALHTSMNRRASVLMPALLKGGLNSKITTKGMFGSGSEKFKISESMSKRLAKNGIKYIETTGSDGKPINFLVYNDGPGGKPMVVAANANERDRIPSTIDIPTGEVDANNNPISSNITVDNKNKFGFDEALEKNRSFFKAEEKSTRTLKGHVAGWFDSAADKVDSMIGNHGRNRQGATQKGASDEEIQKNTEIDGLKEEADDMSGDVEVDRNDNSGGNSNSNGTNDIDPVSAKDGSGAITKGMDTPEVETALKSRAKTAAATLGHASAILNIGGFACAAMKVLNTISLTIGALQRAHIVNYASNFLEVVHKAKAGDSSNELHYFMNGINRRGPTRDINGDIIPGKESSSAMMSDPINEFYSDGNLTVKSKDPSARKFNSELVMQQAIYHGDEIESNDMDQNSLTLESLFSNGGGGLATYKTCVNLQLAGSVLSAVTDIATIVAAIPSFGLAPVLKTIASLIMRQSTAAVLTLAMSGIIAFVAPLVPKILAKNLTKNMVGEDPGYAINSGFHMYAGKQIQISSGLPATEETLLMQYQENQKVIASEARFERETKSPFDTSSRYTFLGSLVNSLAPVATTLSSPLTTFSKLSGTFGSSITKFMPTVSAADSISKIKTSVNKNCPSANAIEPNLVADAFCNTYKTSDFSTISDSFEDVFDNVGDENFQMDKIDDDANNGNPEIKDDSELAKWALSCAVRESPYGVADPNIAEKLSSTFGTSTISQTASALIGSVPIVGTYLNIAQNSLEVANGKWITGENCSDPQYKYFSRYSEDQRLFESAGLIDKSAVTAFLDRHFEKNPLDFTDSGIVARYAGITKEQAELGLGLIEYNLFLAHYNPQDKGPEKKVEILEYQYESRAVIATILPEITKYSSSHSLKSLRLATFTA